MNNKITKLIIGFLLLFPFRLPISILMINIFDWILSFNNKELPMNVICINVITTKVVYNLAVGCWIVFLIEKYTIEMKGRRAKGGMLLSDGVYAHSVFLAMALITFTIIDAVSIYDIFYKP